MPAIVRRSRSLFIALVTLAITAGIALAARPMPAASSDGLATASEASGQTLPVGPVDATLDDQPGATEETGDAAPVQGLDPATAENHGVLVSEAARMATPDGFTNHGEFVSCVPRMNRGHWSADVTEPAAPVDLSQLTPEACQAALAQARDAKIAARMAREEARAAAKAERAAARGERHASRHHGRP